MDKVLKAAAQGDQEAFSSLYYRYKDQVYAAAFRLTESSVTAEEIVQEVFMKLWAKKETLAAIEVFEDYLFIMTRNHVFSAMKKIALRFETEGNWQRNWSGSENGTESFILLKEYETVLQRAIDSLSPQQKQVYLLSREQKLKRDEIARILHISPETVKTHLARALQSIRSYCSSQLGMKLPLSLLLWVDLL